MLPAAVAVRVVIPEVPPIFKIPVIPCVKLPVPDNAAVAFTVPLLVKVTPVIVRIVAQLRVPELVYVPVKVAVGNTIAVEPLKDIPEPLKL